MLSLQATPGLLALTLLPGLSPWPQDPDGADWPQWRGPERTGVSAEADWSPVGKPEPLWVVALGLGHSSFAVADGRVFTLGYDAQAGRDSVFCLDADTGRELWTHSYAADIWDMAHDGGTLTTPTVVAGAVYTSNREGKLFCFDAESGAVRWQRDLRAEEQLEPPTWGFSASPLAAGDLIVMNLGRVLAFDRHSGQDVWASEKSYGISYSTPALFALAGEEYVASLGGDGLAVLKLSDGSEVDFHEWVKNPQIYPATPVIIGDRIFISAGYERGSTMLRLVDGRLEELWSSRIMRNKMSGSVLWREHLFGFDESILKCIDLDGNQCWRQRGLGTGSMSIAGGRLIILDGKGQVIVAEASPEGYVELSRQDVFDEGTSWSTPVLSHGRIYCRSSVGQMACLDYRASAATPPAAEPEVSPELPAAAVVVARHVQAVGGRAALERVSAVRMTGAGESLRNTVRSGEVELDWAAGLGFSWRDDSGFQLAHDRETGWLLGGRSGPELLAGEQLDAAREAGDLARLFDPAAWYASLGRVQRTIFDHRDCYAVEATTAEGHERTLYFELASGLLAGHEGDSIPLWTLRAYREFEGVLLPTQWAFFEPTKGEMNSAVFERAELDPAPLTDRFALPEQVVLLQRTPEEIALANERLAGTHAAILGAWRPEDAEPGEGGMEFEIADGFLVLSSSERGPSRLSEPREDGSLVVIGSAYVSFTPEADESGRVEAIQVRVGGEPQQRLVRPMR